MNELSIVFLYLSSGANLVVTRILGKPVGGKMLRKAPLEARRTPRIHRLTAFQKNQGNGLLLKVVLDFRKMLGAEECKLLVEAVVTGTLAKMGEE